MWLLSTIAIAAVPRPCDVFEAAKTPCVAAHSTVRALFARYVKAPVLSVDTREVDFREPEAVASLVERIRRGDTAPIKGANLFG